MTNIVVQRALIENIVAVGVELHDGPRLAAAKEVSVSYGSLRTPQILMLSGIGPLSELFELDDKQVADLSVGQYLHYHKPVNIVWKFKNPEEGYVIGSPTFNKSEYGAGNPMDWMATAAASDEDLPKAADIDGAEFQSDVRTDYEVTVLYGVIAAAPVELASMDGTHITTGILRLSPTSRGTVTLASKSATDSPIIDPRYFFTEHDRAVLRAGMRFAL